MAQSFGLPEGGATSNVDKAIEAWEEFARPFEELTGLKMCAFDPGIDFRIPNDPHSQTVQLDKWVMKRINAGLAKLKEE